MDNQKKFEQDMQVYEICGLFNGLSQEISMMGFSLSSDDLQLMTERLDRWQSTLALIKSKLEEIQIDKILNDD